MNTHTPGRPIRDYVRMIFRAKEYDKSIKSITIYGITIPIEATVNKTVGRFYTSTEYRNLVAMNGHPSNYTPFAIRQKTHALPTLHND